MTPRLKFHAGAFPYTRESVRKRVRERHLPGVAHFPLIGFYYELGGKTYPTNLVPA